MRWYETGALDYVVTREEWEKRCKWDDLSSEEQEACGYGGCGLNLFGCIKIIPDFVFKRACWRHDFGYLRGGSEHIRGLIDSNFAEEVRKLALEYGRLNAYRYWAEAYIAAVRRVGYMAWDYGPMKGKAEILEEARKKSKQRVARQHGKN